VGSAHADNGYCRYNSDDPLCAATAAPNEYDDIQDFAPPPRHRDRDWQHNDEPQVYTAYDDAYSAYDYPAPRPKHRVQRRTIGSCAAVGRALRDYGFRRIQPLDCQAKNYTFAAFRGYQPFIVRVDRFNGRIRQDINY
jgi:hypothetical protein